MRSRVDGIWVIRVPLADGNVRGLLARGAPGIVIPERPSADLERVLVLQGEVICNQTSAVTPAGAELIREPDRRGPLTLGGAGECLFCIWVGPERFAHPSGSSSAAS